ncbi:MAG: 6-carboxytetrahydropterin synthase [Chloroflexi bacterium]|nr:6-carboxytetrahydropterin synthase [Chloroflexota bacterium]
MSRESFKVRVTKDYTVFCAGHFVTYNGDKLEPLHGHNYRAAAVVEGKLNEDNYVVDFIVLKRLLREICNRLDHKMLLATNNPLLDISQNETSFTVRHHERIYVFPREDVTQLPIPNTTAERIAEWISGEIEADFRARGLTGLTALEVEVEETFGQSAFFRKEL